MVTISDLCLVNQWLNYRGWPSHYWKANVGDGSFQDALPDRTSRYSIRKSLSPIAGPPLSRVLEPSPGPRLPVTTSRRKSQQHTRNRGDDGQSTAVSDQTFPLPHRPPGIYASFHKGLSKANDAIIVIVVKARPNLAWRES